MVCVVGVGGGRIWRVLYGAVIVSLYRLVVLLVCRVCIWKEGTDSVQQRLAVYLLNGRKQNTLIEIRPLMTTEKQPKA